MKEDMTTKRSSRAEIYKKVIQVLKERDANVYQIKVSLGNGLSWDAIKNALDVLKEMGLVKQEEGEFSLKSNDMDLNPKTYFGLPLSEEKENQFYALASRINSEWPYKPLKKTFLQKMIVTLIERENLDLPYGYYLFGKCTPMKFNDELWKEHEPENRFNTQVKKIVKKFQKYSNTRELMESRCTEQDMPLYNTRLSIDLELKKPFDKEKKYRLHALFKSLIMNFDKNDDNKDIWEYIDYFFSVWSRLKKLDEEDLESIRMDIIDSFQSLWKLIGTYKFYRSMSDYFGSRAKIYYEREITSLKNVTQSQIESLEEFCPELRTDPELEGLRGIRATRHQ